MSPGVRPGSMGILGCRGDMPAQAGAGMGSGTLGFLRNLQSPRSSLGKEPGPFPVTDVESGLAKSALCSHQWVSSPAPSLPSRRDGD